MNHQSEHYHSAELRERLARVAGLAHASDPELARAAVLVGVSDESDCKVLLTLRSRRLSTHAGEVAFTGGMRDATDASLSAALRREAQEEVGLSADDIQLIGSMPMQISRFGVSVTPFVAMVPPQFDYTANPAEIDSIFEVPVAWLLTPGHQDWMQMENGWACPVYNYGEYRIWGLTSIILTQFLNIAFDAGLRMPTKQERGVGEGPAP